MNNPVRLAIAKLLKQKGVDISTEWAYQGDNLVHDSHNKERKNWNEEPHVDCSAPTVAEVVMWFYENGVWIYADSHEFGKWCYYYRYNRPHQLSPKLTENGQFGIDDYDSPTEAYEAAIEYILINCIS